ncbi:MAG: hypothetical protein GXO30_03455, partial [Epsilonproteobacteria bacterium]|nr:hypothetical protein [Campylobacterota bacterium]
LNKIRVSELSFLNVSSHVFSEKFRLALLLPYKVIGRYSKSTTNSAFAYLISKKAPFELKTYKIESETQEEIQEALNKIYEDGFSYVIAPMTQKGLKVIAEINPQINIYFPTINENNTQVNSPYFTYGAIDYKAQSDLLLKKATSPLVILSDKSSIGKNLSLYQSQKFQELDEETYQKRVVKFFISKKTTNLQWQFKNNKKIAYGSFLINTPIIKTGMIMSQITLYDREATNILSTQINYNPLLLSITQYEDRKNMYIANSIIKNDDEVLEASSIFGTDILYNWINYATTVGTDYFYSLVTSKQRKFDIEIQNQQVQYPIELLRPSRYKFIKEIDD